MVKTTPRDGKQDRPKLHNLNKGMPAHIIAASQGAPKPVAAFAYQEKHRNDYMGQKVLQPESEFRPAEGNPADESEFQHQEESDFHNEMRLNAAILRDGRNLFYFYFNVPNQKPPCPLQGSVFFVSVAKQFTQTDR
jgi:hypothetical protein